MKLKFILLVTLLASNLTLADSLDTSLPDLGDVSQTVLTPQEEQRIAVQIPPDVATPAPPGSRTARTTSEL